MELARHSNAGEDAQGSQVPKGPMKLARRFNAGITILYCASPGGTAGKPGVESMVVPRGEWRWPPHYYNTWTAVAAVYDRRILVLLPSPEDRRTSRRNCSGSRQRAAYLILLLFLGWHGRLPGRRSLGRGGARTAGPLARRKVEYGPTLKLPQSDRRGGAGSSGSEGGALCPAARCSSASRGRARPPLRAVPFSPFHPKTSWRRSTTVAFLPKGLRWQSAHSVARRAFFHPSSSSQRLKPRPSFAPAHRVGWNRFGHALLFGKKRTCRAGAKGIR